MVAELIETNTYLNLIALKQGDSGGPVFIKDENGKFIFLGVNSQTAYGIVPSRFCDVEYHLRNEVNWNKMKELKEAVAECNGVNN